jgi:hypothetical protein
MKIFVFALAAGWALVAFADGAHAGAGTSGLTPEQKARCERFEQNKLRNSRMPGTTKGPKFCRTG